MARTRRRQIKKPPRFDISSLPFEFFDSVTIYTLRESIKRIEGLRRDERAMKSPAREQNIKDFTESLDHLRKTLEYYGG